MVFAEVGKGRKRELVNCHHNYSAREVHEGREVWVTRKGAIRAGVGDLGVIPGSMGTSTYIVEGLGNPAVVRVVLARRRPPDVADQGPQAS